MKASQKQRSLAYLLAKTIDIEELDEVSGGSQGGSNRWSNRDTYKASGSGAHNLDVVVDWSIDC